MTMPDTLHLSASSFTTNPLHSPSKHPNFPSLSRPRNLHFRPPPSSKSPTISFPTKPPQIPSITPTPQHKHPQDHQESNKVSISQNPNLEFQEKLLYLDSIGIELFSFLTTHPPILSTSLGDIKSMVDFFYSIGLTTPDIRRVLAMCPEILTTPLTTVIPVITFLLREAHVDGSRLRHVIHRRPRLLTCSVQTRLRPTLYFLQGTIGIESINKCTSLFSCSVEEKFLPRIEYIQKLGFSYDNTISMFRRLPSLFCYSIEENFEPKFDYFVVEMGRDLRELKEFPHYFSFSLENRIKPRHRRCMEKGIFLSLPAMLKSSEERFRDRLEVCCSSSMPVRTSPLWCTNTNFDVNAI